MTVNIVIPRFCGGYDPKSHKKWESGNNWPPPQNNALVFLSDFLYNNIIDSLFLCLIPLSNLSKYNQN